MPKQIRSLDGVKLGDTFMVYGNHGFSSEIPKMVSVERITAKQAFIGGQAYWIKDASIVGKSYRFSSNRYLYEIDQSEIERGKLLRMRINIGNFSDWKSVSDSDVKKIHDILFKR